MLRIRNSFVHVVNSSIVPKQCSFRLRLKLKDNGIIDSMLKSLVSEAPSVRHVITLVISDRDVISTASPCI